MDIDEEFGYWAIDHGTTFPPGFFDIGNKTFTWVFENKKEFVEFIILVSNPTGLFLSFQKYCTQRMGLSNEI